MILERFRQKPGVLPDLSWVSFSEDWILEWRVLYVAKFAEAVHVLHAFQKKTQKTRSEDIELARKRYRQNGDRS